MQRVWQVLSSRLFLVVAGLLLGALLVMGIRFATYAPVPAVHYHANFAVYINGHKEAFAAPNYYEEEATTTCSASEDSTAETTPMSRVHMHGNVNNVVHVEDTRVTWGNFFTVLGWNIGDQYVATRDAVYQDGDQGTVTYLLNGRTVHSLANTVISDQDTLLVNYGTQTSAQIKQEYGKIKNNALLADRSKDPAACGGSVPDSISISERMKHIL